MMGRVAAGVFFRGSPELFAHALGLVRATTPTLRCVVLCVCYAVQCEALCLCGVMCCVVPRSVRYHTVHTYAYRLSKASTPP